MRNTLLTLGLFIATAASAAEFSTPFGHGMVLQRNREVPVWGKAAPGETVVVTFAGQEKRAVVDQDGRWKVSLSPMAACKQGRELKVSSADGKISQVLDDVVVGEVWLVSGQSNCEMPLASKNAHFSDRHGALVAQMTHQPNIRFAQGSTLRWSTKPRTELRKRAEWKKFLPENLGGDSKSFSAMAVYFALDLYAALDIPIGLIGVYWGATAIEPWIPHDAFIGLSGFEWCRDWKYIAEKDWKDAPNKRHFRYPNSQPSALWNDMLEPWCPMAARGVIWYQGCSNSHGNGKDDNDDYRRLMHALYDSWSRHFANPELKFYFVQLAPYAKWWDIQMAQERFAAEEPNAGMVVSCDLGNLHDIHPNDKLPIGKRLAAMALSRDYGFSDIVGDSPKVRSCRAEGDVAVLSFDKAKRWSLYNSNWSVDVPFELKGDDGVWKQARLLNENNGHTNTVPWETKGNIAGAELRLKADGVLRPIGVRHLYLKPWHGVLYADSGLPLGPFECAVSNAVNYGIIPNNKNDVSVKSHITGEK